MKKKKSGKFKSDKEAEDFLEQDLTDFINPRKDQRVTYEFLPKTEKVSLRFPQEAYKRCGKKLPAKACLTRNISVRRWRNL